MKKHVLSAGLAIVIGLGAPMAAHAGDYYGGSRYSRDPYDQCMDQRRSHGVTGGILGAVAGGLFGNGVAAHKNRTEGAVLGAVVGAVAGNAIGKSNSQCSTVSSYSRSSSYSDPRPYSESRYDDRYADERDYRDDRDYRDYRDDGYYDRGDRTYRRTTYRYEERVYEDR
ncbi:MAG: glycine zipper domain-containing protein [Caulobacterales bacterium]